MSVCGGTKAGEMTLIAMGWDRIPYRGLGDYGKGMSHQPRIQVLLFSCLLTVRL